MVAGVPRKIFFLNFTLAAAMVMAFKSFYVVPLIVILHVLFVVASKHDTKFIEVGIRHLKHKDYYDV